jgi:hypothetical protein
MMQHMSVALLNPQPDVPLRRLPRTEMWLRTTYFKGTQVWCRSDESIRQIWHRFAGIHGGAIRTQA